MLPRSLKRYASTLSAINALPASKTRNVGIIAHIDAGKTTTTERLLYYSGATSEIGDVDHGDTITDYLPAERERGITIQSAAVSFPWNGHKINLVDTPGHADFTFEVTRTLRVLDGSVTILDAVAGVEAQTEQVWAQSKSLGIPSIVFVNKMDRMGAGFSRTCFEIMTKLKTRVVLANIPHLVEDKETREPQFCGVVDVFRKKLLRWDSAASDGSKVECLDLEDPKVQESYPREWRELCASREAAIETLCEFDDVLVDEFLAHEDYMAVSASEIEAALRRAMLKHRNEVTPVLCGASFRNIGVQPLLDAIVSYLPSPLDAVVPEVKTRHTSAVSGANLPAEFTESGLVVNRDPLLTVALAFKVVTDFRKAPMIFVRVYSGRLLSGSTVLDTRTGKRFRVNNMFLMSGSATEPIERCGAGNICVVTASLISSKSGSGSGSDSGDSGAFDADGDSDMHVYDTNSTFGSTEMNEIRTGDTIVAHAMKKDGTKGFKKTTRELQLNPITIPPSIFVTSLEPHTLNDKKLLDENLKILLREDPSLRVFENEEGQTLVSGMGELHLEIVKNRLIDDLKTRCDISRVMVTYRETITGTTESVEKRASVTEKEAYVVRLRVEPAATVDGEAAEASSESSGSGSKGSKGSKSSKSSKLAPVTVFDLENGNSVTVPKEAAPAAVQQFWRNTDAADGNADFWPLQLQHAQIAAALVSSCTSVLQSGPRHALPLTGVRVVVERWDVPKAAVDAKPVLSLARDALLEALGTLSTAQTAVLEPVMRVRVSVKSEDVGSVAQDLTSTRKAEITEIEGSGALEDDFAKQARAQYLPHDATNVARNAANSARQVIHATAPLSEMIGYSTKLRSLTKGHGTFSMEYSGLRATHSYEG